MTTETIVTLDAESESLLRIAGDIIVALLARRDVEPEELPAIILSVRAALAAPLGDAGEGCSATAVTIRPRTASGWSPGVVAAPGTNLRTSPPVPAVPVEASIAPDYIVSLEDGKRYRSLRRHLMAKYGMTPDDYRAKWNLPPDYPMVAPDYAKSRSEVAKRIGLGRRTQVARSPSRRHREGES